MPTPFTGPAGEHYVLYRLIRMEYIAGLAPENSPNADIIASNVLGKKAAAIQVKTRRPLGSDSGWHMRAKHEKLIGERMFYCLVDLKENIFASPDVYIVPSFVVAAALKEQHQIWLLQPGKNGQLHQDNDMRRLVPDYSKFLKLTEEQHQRLGAGWLEQYKENWSILGLG